MKTKIALLVSMILACGLTRAGDTIDPSGLPPAVKKTLDASAQSDAVKQITIHKAGGRTVYDIELERKNAPNPRLRIAENGELLRDSAAARTPDMPSIYSDGIPLGTPDGTVPALASTAPKLKLGATPDPVQQTIKKESAGKEIAAIERTTWNGKIAYRVTFEERGRNPELYVAEDGSLLKPMEKPPALFVGTRFEELPAAVQQTIRREAGNGEILKIDRDSGRRGEAASYKIELKDARGAYQLRVSETGQVLENTRPTERVPKRG